MNSAQDRPILKRYIFSCLLGAAMVFAVFCYGFGVHSLSSHHMLDSIASQGVAKLRIVFLILTVGAYIAIHFVRASILRKKTGSLMTVAELADRLTQSTAVIMALCEAPAIYGFITFLLSHNPTDFHFFAAISLCGFAVYFPRYGRWKSWIQSQLP